jgi:YD repeat-containing protein
MKSFFALALALYHAEAHAPPRRLRSRCPRWLRWSAFFCTALFVWSFVLSTPVYALSHQPSAPRLGVRVLTPAEMGRILGRQSSPGDHQTATSPASGDTYPWEASVAGTNTGNGNKTTTLPIVGWTVRGGMPVSFTLTHNSQSAHNSELGYKWTHSYDLFLVTDLFGNATAHWGDDLAYTFTRNIDGSFIAPTGIHESLVKNTDNTYTLTTHSQIKYHYKTNLYCDTITDENANAISLTYNTGNYVTAITDPTSRSITLSYDTSNRISTITDPLSRQWSLSYDTSGNLSSVSYPTLNSTTYSTAYTYNTNHDITNIQTPEAKTGDTPTTAVTTPWRPKRIPAATRRVIPTPSPERPSRMPTATASPTTMPPAKSPRLSISPAIPRRPATTAATTRPRL